MAAVHLDRYSLVVERECRICGSTYSVEQYLDQEMYFGVPYRYIDGCQETCLECWLGVGPMDDTGLEIPPRTVETCDFQLEVPHNQFRVGPFELTWPFHEEKYYARFWQGDLATAYEWFFDSGWHLALLPITRVTALRPVFFPNGGAIYPVSGVRLDDLHPVHNSADSDSHPERCSAASGLTIDALQQTAVVVVPVRLEWGSLVRGSHREHLSAIRRLSELVDRTMLDFCRFQFCRLHRPDGLPAHAGQIKHQSQMAGALIYNHSLRESRLFGGAAFTHALTSGIGMPLTQLEFDQMPLDGEVGHIVDHGLSLYGSLLEASSETSKFTQAIALLEYLAFPGEYRPLQKVRAVVVRCVAGTPQEREWLTERFKNVLFGPEGYRTHIVHNGKRLDQLVPNARERVELLCELDSYIRAMLGDMIVNSTMRWQEYADSRKRTVFGHVDEGEDAE